MSPPNQDPKSSQVPGRRVLTALGSSPQPPGADLELVRGALGGDRHCVAALIERLRMIPRVLHCKNRRMGGPLSKEDLEDVAQEILSTIWRRLETYHGGSPIEAWAYRFCSLTFMNSLRKKRRQPALSELEDGLELADPSPAASEHDPLQIAHLLQNLKEDHARPIRMKIYEGLPFQSIADLLEIPISTAKARYYRGLESLRQMLESSAEGGLS